MPYRKIFLALSLIAFSLSGYEISAQQSDDPEKMYNTLAGNDSLKINRQIVKYNKATTVRAKAYKGALLMKKAGMLKKPADKISAFKEGRSLLEEAINTDSNNVEFRFLRLMIQEHAPDILRYKGDIEEDATMVTTYFSGMSEDLKKAVRSYSQKSRAISQEQLN